MIIEYDPYGDTIRIPGFDPANAAAPLQLTRLSL